MKKYGTRRNYLLFLLAVMFTLSIGMAQQVQAKTTYISDDLEYGTYGNDDEDPIKVKYGKKYAVCWRYDTRSEKYNQFKVSKKGVLTFRIKAGTTKAIKKTMSIKITDAKGKNVWTSFGIEDKPDSKGYYKYKIGLAPGTYTLELHFNYGTIGKIVPAYYSFSFSAKKYTETESNNSKKKATSVVLDKTYSGVFDGCGWLGEDEGSYDYYKIKLKKTHVYEFHINNLEGLRKQGVNIGLIQSGKNKSITMSYYPYGAKPYYFQSARATGYAYLIIYYPGVNLKKNVDYSFKIVDRALKNQPSRMTPVIQSPSPGVLNVLFWYFGAGNDGYQIRYATNPNMEGARSKYVKWKDGGQNFRGLPSGTTYYVQIRAYVVKKNGKKWYGDWSFVDSTVIQ